MAGGGGGLPGRGARGARAGRAAASRRLNWPSRGSQDSRRKAQGGAGVDLGGGARYRPRGPRVATAAAPLARYGSSWPGFYLPSPPAQAEFRVMPPTRRLSRPSPRPLRPSRPSRVGSPEDALSLSPFPAAPATPGPRQRPPGARGGHSQWAPVQHLSRPRKGPWPKGTPAGARRSRSRASNTICKSDLSTRPCKAGVWTFLTFKSSSTLLRTAQRILVAKDLQEVQMGQPPERNRF